MNNQKGFSLIELMIVVAIIGILSAIAVPNFQRFQSKARQSEAKGNLAGYYQANQAGFAEFGFYAGNFVAIGYRPDGNINYRIQAANGVGVGGATMPMGLPSQDSCTTTGSPGDCSDMTVTWTEVTGPSIGVQPVAAGNFAVDNNATPPTFMAGAAGRIGTPTVDHWRIDQQKRLTNTASGLP